MMGKGFIVNIEIATSKIVGIIARRNEQDITSIVGAETIPTQGCVKHGTIYNIDATAGKIKKLINLLENKIGDKIGACYVTLNGKGLKGLRHKETKILSTNAPITLTTLDELESKIRQAKPEFYINYGVSNISYSLDGVLTESPLGQNGHQLDAQSTIIIGPPSIKSNAQKAVEAKNNLKIFGYIWGTVALGSILLDQESMNNGCLLLDLGAGSTTASIFKNGTLQYMTEVPLGSNTITKDIQSLGFDLETSEMLKRKYVNLGSKQESDIDKPKNVDMKKLNKIVKLRVDEILLNVLERLKESGVFHKLDDGIFTTGGGSLLNGITEYIENLLGLPAKKSGINRLLINNVNETLNTPEYHQILGSLLYAKNDCSYVKPVEVTKSEPKIAPTEHVNETAVKKNDIKKKKGVWTKLKDITSNFGSLAFNEDEDEPAK